MNSAWFRFALAIARKDLVAELRSKEILLTSGFFGFLVVLMLSFAFFHGDVPMAPVGAGALWVAICFSGVLALGRSIDREREGDCFRSLLLTPVPRTAIYFGKTAAILCFMGVVEWVLIPAVIVFFNLPTDGLRLPYLLLTVGLGTLGYAIVGTLLAAGLMHAESRVVLLSIIVNAVMIPVLIVGTKASALLLGAAADLDYAAVRSLLQVLATFDLVFLVGALWTFELLILD